MHRIARMPLLLLAVIVLGADRSLLADGTKATVGPIPPGLSLVPFYKKHTDALGILIVSSEKVPDAALLVARDIVIPMLAKRPDVREALVARKMRVVVMAQSESTTDLPEQRNWKKPSPNDPRLTQRERDNYEQGVGRMTDKEYWDRRARGMGGNPTSGAEANLLGYPGTRYFGENILVHELSHAIMDIGLRRSDPKLVAAIRDAYKEAMRKGLWKNHYASTNASEYWAEGTQTWFWSNYEYVDGERRVQSPEDLKAYDPTLYELLERVYPDHHIPADIYHGKNLKPGRRRPITPESGAGKDERCKVPLNVRMTETVPDTFFPSRTQLPFEPLPPFGLPTVPFVLVPDRITICFTIVIAQFHVEFAIWVKFKTSLSPHRLSCLLQFSAHFIECATGIHAHSKILEFPGFRHVLACVIDAFRIVYGINFGERPSLGNCIHDRICNSLINHLDAINHCSVLCS